MASKEEKSCGKRTRDCSSTPEKKKKIRGESATRTEKRVQRYRQEWQENTIFKKWLRPVPKIPEKAQCLLGKSEFVADISVIKMHAAGKKHLSYVKGVGLSSIEEAIGKVNEKRKIDTDFDLQKKTAEIKISGYVASQNLAVRRVDHLTNVCKSAFTDSKIAESMKLGRTKATNIICNVIAKCHREKCINIFKQTKFSVIINEGTDIAGLKTLAVCIRYFDEKIGGITTEFWSLIQIFDGKERNRAHAGATAERLYEELVESFKEAEIPLKNIIGFASDGCNVMFGEHNSVASRMKQLQDGIVLMKCICHSLHLCASEACKMLPKHCEDLARNVYTFFNHSGKRQAALQEFQDFCEVEPHKVLRPAQTRWLSLLQVVKRILEQWDALQLFFTSQWIEEKLVAAETLFNELKDDWLKLYYLFLGWVLPKVVKINEYFQSEKVVITTVHSKMVETFSELLLTYMKPDVVKIQDVDSIQPDNEQLFVPLPQIYLGVNVMRKLQEKHIQAEAEKIKNFLYRARAFTITLCQQLKKRYDFSDGNIISKLAWFNPRCALMTDTKKPTSIANLIDSLPCIVPRKNVQLAQKIDDQWRKIPITSFPLEWLDKPVDKVWLKIREYTDLAGQKEYQEIGQFALDLFVLPHSSDSCERTFSKVNLIKTKSRNKLITNTLNGLLLSSKCVAENGGGHFQPSKQMLDSMTTNNLYSHRRCNTQQREKKGSQEYTDDEKENVDLSDGSDVDDEIIIDFP